MNSTNSTMAENAQSLNMCTGSEPEAVSQDSVSIKTILNLALTSSDHDRTVSSVKKEAENGNHSESSEDYNQNRKIIVFPQQEIPPPMSTLHALQEWEGYVVEIHEDEFVAMLVDLTAGHDYETEEATIPMKEISGPDAANMKLGSFFRWVIGYEKSPEGTRKRVSEIIFLDLPRVTERDLQAAWKWASEMETALNP